MHHIHGQSVAWACAHPHATALEAWACASGWMCIEGEGTHAPWDLGVQDGDYLLFVACADGSGLYDRARSLADTAPLRLADQAGRRLMLWSDRDRCWFPVMP